MGIIAGHLLSLKWWLASACAMLQLLSHKSAYWSILSRRPTLLPTKFSGALLPLKLGKTVRRVFHVTAIDAWYGKSTPPRARPWPATTLPPREASCPVMTTMRYLAASKAWLSEGGGQMTLLEGPTLRVRPLKLPYNTIPFMCCMAAAAQADSV